MPAFVSLPPRRDATSAIRLLSRRRRCSHPATRHRYACHRPLPPCISHSRENHRNTMTCIDCARHIQPLRKGLWPLSIVTLNNDTVSSQDSREIGNVVGYRLGMAPAGNHSPKPRVTPHCDSVDSSSVRLAVKYGHLCDSVAVSDASNVAANPTLHRSPCLLTSR